MLSSINANGNSKWTDEQLKLAFHLYCQLPFGKLHAKNKSIIQLADVLGRSPNSVAMKLVNFASLDPTIINSGRKGLSNASVADRRIWNEFHADWNSLTVECDELLNQLSLVEQVSVEESDYTGKTRLTSTQVRIKQGFFRNTILAGYNSRCCMSGVSHNQLLVASHIIPWSQSDKQRLNPRNGLCLSGIHDRAFDGGLITVKPDMTIQVSKALIANAGEGEQSFLLAQLQGRKIHMPSRFFPDESFLRWHNMNIFRG